MAYKHRLLWPVFLLGILVVLTVPLANADPVKKATDLAVFQPIEIPGMVLMPGNYVMKVPDPVSHADMVGFYNEDESQLIKLVRTIPRYRLDSTDKTAITFEERTGGAPDAIKSWFYPGDNWGKEFVYGKVKTLTVAEAAAPSPTPAPALAPEVIAPAAEPAREPIAETRPAPVEIAEATPQAAAAAVAPAVPAPEAVAPEAVAEQLPKTGTSLPLLGMLGTFSLALGLGLRWLSK